MKKVVSMSFNLVGVCLLVLVLLCSTATAKILFQDKFKNAAGSEKNWIFAQGEWKIQGGKMTQGAAADRAIAIISDEAWPEEFDAKETALTQYIFEVTVKKLRGDNGALIFWRIRDDMKNQVGRECGAGFNSSWCLDEAGVPGRLEEIGKSRIKFWWDIGREGKTSVLVRDLRGIARDKEGTETKHKLSKNKEVRVKIENDVNLIKLYLDDELIHEGKDINGGKAGGRIALGTHGTVVAFSDVLLTDLKGEGVQPGDKITTTWGSLKTRP